jgi:hypothetical protein
MLSIRNYRTPKTIFELFKKRCKSLLKMNTWVTPFLLIDFMLMIKVFDVQISLVECIVAMASIIAISIYTSVLSLTKYYILHPYVYNDIIKEITSSRPFLEMIIEMINLVIIFASIFVGKTILTSSLLIICYIVIFVPLAFALVYKIAPKTYKLKYFTI